MNDCWFYLDPVPKPRMVASDKWAKRPIVEKYFAFCNEIRLKAGDFVLGDEIEINFNMSIPRSLSLKKRAELDGMPHRKRPDLDNLVKAVCDALNKEDSHIWRIKAKKQWVDSNTGSIYIKNLTNNL